MSNIYYNPEHFGVVTVGEVEWSEPSYSFDLTVVVRNPDTGVLYAVSDSGCSCPSPFEDVASLASADVKGTPHDIAKFLQDTLDERTYDQDFAAPQVTDLIVKLMKL